MSNSRRIDNNTFGENATIHQGDVNNVYNYAQGTIIDAIQRRTGLITVCLTEGRETPPQPSQLIPFPRDPDFVNRGDILDQISERCLEPAGRVALVGLGGVGKSQLAIEFAHRLADKHNNIWVFWIHAATQERVQEGFRLIADAVKLPERKQPTANIPLLVKNWLSIEHNGRWIIILDSADETEVLYSASESVHGKRSLAAYIPKSRNGAIVLTTRNRSLASKLTGGHKHIIDVDTMSEADALTLLERKMGSPLLPSEASLAEDLVKALECIPLAIGQAAAYIQARRPRSSIEKYLAEFRKSERGSMKLLKHEANDIGRDEETSNTVLRTWAMSFDYIRSRQQSAADLLSLMSFFDRQGIPEWVLKGFRMRTKSLNGNEASKSEASESETGDDSDGDIESGFEEDILVLKDFCLIAVSEEGDRFEMHRLVQLSIKSWLKAAGLQEEFMQQYITQMAESFPEADYENWATCQDLFAHVQMALDYRPNEDNLRHWGSLFYRGGHYAFQQGKYYLAEQMSKKSKKAREKKFRKNASPILQSMSLLAMIITNQGRWDEAEKLGVKITETQKTKLGADHLYTLTSMNNLAVTYRKLGRCDEAEKLQVQVLEARKKTLGTDHPDTLLSMAHLAATYKDQGRWEEAEKLHVQVLEARKKTLGADHLYTLTSMSSLAFVYMGQGRLKEAEKLGMQVLEVSKKTFGTDDPNTMRSMKSLALILKRQDRHEDALALMKDCLQARQRVLGLQHQSTLNSLKLVEEWSKKSG